MTTRSAPIVVNRHRFLPTEGAGPGPWDRTPRMRRPELPEPWIYVGRGTPLGNPFVVGRDGDRARCLALYRVHLHDRIQAGDPAVLAELARITPETALVCSCAPHPCHADVIVRAWRWLRTTGGLK